MDKSRKPNLLIFFFAFMAFAISVYILVAVKSHRVIYGCGSGGCHEILAGRWERWGPVPVSTLGIFGYLALMSGAIFTSVPKLKRRYAMVWYLMAVESIVGLGFIAWLIYLQGAVIKHFCVYCLTSHAFGSVAYLITMLKVPVWNRHRHSRLFVGTTASAILTAMIAVHIVVVPDIHASQDAADIEYALPAENSGVIQFGKPARTERTVHLLNNQLNFDVYKLPVLGNREAEHVLLELSDYNCPSCRKLAARLDQFAADYDLDFCVVFLPTPFNSTCNHNVKKTPPGFETSCTLARYSLAVNVADQTKFEKFHQYLMTGLHAPKPKDARAKAEKLVGKEAFAKALQSPEIKNWLSTATGVQSFIKAKTIPRLISQNQVVSYSGGSKAGFVKLIKEALNLDEVHKKTN